LSCGLTESLDEQIEQVHGLIHAGLTDEPFWLSAARAGVLFDKGNFSVEADGNCRGRVLKKLKRFSSERKFSLFPKFFSI
jgi:hypothetical protein